MEIQVNGAPHNEAGLNAIRLGHHGVPVVLVAGDDALAGEVEALLPWAERVVVKRALGTNVTDALARGGHRAIRDEDGARAGQARRDAALRPDLPIDGEVDSRVPIMADYACVLPGTERIGPRTVGFRADDGDAFYRTCSP